MDYFRFFLNHKKLISFGFLLTFFSSFGQTFLLSLYVPALIGEFELTNSSFGGLYAIATVASSVILIFAGKLIDHADLRKYTLCSAAALLAACVVLGLSTHLFTVFVGLLGLRLAGQGLLTHISSTSISRHFEAARGKALSLTTLGFSLGEGVFPIAVGMIIGMVGWRTSMLLNAAMIGTLLLPFVYLVLADYRQPEHFSTGSRVQLSSRRELLKDTNFYLIAANTCVSPFLVTGLFFYQLVLAREKGWSVEWLGTSFLGFAAGRVIFALLSGKIIDRFSAAKVTPYYLLPQAGGLIGLLLTSHPAVFPVYLFLTGVSVGFASTVKTALIAEVYGTRNIGGIRSVFSTVMVFGTAMSPLLFGMVLDGGGSFDVIILFSLVLLCAVSMLSVQIGRRFERSPAGNAVVGEAA